MAENNFTRRKFLTTAAGVAGMAVAGVTVGSGLITNPLGLSRLPTTAQLDQMLHSYVTRPLGISDSVVMLDITQELAALKEAELTHKAGPGLAKPLTAGLGALVIRWLGNFAKEVAVEVMANSVAEWLKNLNWSARTHVQEINTRMERGGFTDYSSDRVYGTRGIAVYGIGQTDNRNGCAPLYITYRNGNLSPPIMVEGPTIMGLHAGAKHWNNRHVEVGDGLIPRQTDKNVFSQFEKSMSEPLFAQTTAGRMSVYYEKHPRLDYGVARIGSMNHQGDWLHSGEYGLDFSSI